jgi:hypothetical protein
MTNLITCFSVIEKQLILSETGTQQQTSWDCRSAHLHLQVKYSQLQTYKQACLQNCLHFIYYKKEQSTISAWLLEGAELTEQLYWYSRQQHGREPGTP